jgi:hypothetical protein
MWPFDRKEILSPTVQTEDMRLLSAAVRALATLEARATEVTGQVASGVKNGAGAGQQDYVGRMTARDPPGRGNRHTPGIGRRAGSLRGFLPDDLSAIRGCRYFLRQNLEANRNAQKIAVEAELARRQVHL